MQSSTMPPLGRHTTVYMALPSRILPTSLVTRRWIASAARGPSKLTSPMCETSNDLGAPPSDLAAPPSDPGLYPLLPCGRSGSAPADALGRMSFGMAGDWRGTMTNPWTAPGTPSEVEVRFHADGTYLATMLMA